MSDRHQRSDGRRLARPEAGGLGIRRRRAAAPDRRRLSPAPHRGMLPDVDFDRAIPDPGYRPLLSRIADFLWGDLRRSPAQPDAEAELRAALAAVLGERLAAAYIGEDETGRRCDSGVDRGFDQAGRRFDKSRLRARRVRVARAFTSIECQDTCSAGLKTD